MAENKTPRITKANRFEDIKAMLQNMEVTYGTSLDDAIQFINHELDLLARKNNSDSKKMTETQKRNEKHKENILVLLKDYVPTEDEPGMTCSMIIKAMNDPDLENPQKVSPLMRQLEKAGKTDYVTRKGRTYWILAEEEEVEIA